jgi:hypothetical protein
MRAKKRAAEGSESRSELMMAAKKRAAEGSESRSERV